MINEIRLVYGEGYEAVYLDGDRLSPGPSQRIFNHSPDGFAWGYYGSGPSQLALAILLDVTADPELSVRYHQAFKEDFVAKWPEGRDKLVQVFEVDVMGWVADETEHRSLAA